MALIEQVAFISKRHPQKQQVGMRHKYEHLIGYDVFSFHFLFLVLVDLYCTISIEFKYFFKNPHLTYTLFRIGEGGKDLCALSASHKRLE